MENTDQEITTSAAYELGNCSRFKGRIFSMTEAHGSPCSHECHAEAPSGGLSPVVRRRARGGLPLPAGRPGLPPAGRRDPGGPRLPVPEPEGGRVTSDGRGGRRVA